MFAERIQWVSDRPRQGPQLTPRLVSTLTDKLPKAEEHLAELEEYLKTIEDTVVKACDEARTKQGNRPTETENGNMSVVQWHDKRLIVLVRDCVRWRGTAKRMEGD